MQPARALTGKGAAERLAVRPRRVLIVDDNCDVANSSALLLEAYGQHVMTAYNPVTAVRIAAEFKPELVLLDLDLETPGITGLDVVKQMRRLPHMKRAVIVAHTGYARADHESAALAAGFDQLIEKPASLGEVLYLLR